MYRSYWIEQYLFKYLLSFNQYDKECSNLSRNDISTPVARGSTWHWFTLYYSFHWLFFYVKIELSTIYNCKMLCACAHFWATCFNLKSCRLYEKWLYKLFWRSSVGKFWSTFSPSNIFQILFLSERFHQHCQIVDRLTLQMLRLLSSKAQWCKDFRKPSKPCHAGIYWIAPA